jgi:hypothetical protein
MDFQIVNVYEHREDTESRFDAASDGDSPLRVTIKNTG